MQGGLPPSGERGGRRRARVRHLGANEPALRSWGRRAESYKVRVCGSWLLPGCPPHLKGVGILGPTGDTLVPGRIPKEEHCAPRPHSGEPRNLGRAEEKEKQTVKNLSGSGPHQGQSIHHSQGELGCRVWGPRLSHLLKQGESWSKGKRGSGVEECALQLGDAAPPTSQLRLSTHRSQKKNQVR